MHNDCFPHDFETNKNFAFFSFNESPRYKSTALTRMLLFGHSLINHYR